MKIENRIFPYPVFGVNQPQKFTTKLTVEFKKDKAKFQISHRIDCEEFLKRIKKKEDQYYWSHLNNCIEENKYKIEKSKLNITEKKGEEEGTVITKVISDGADYSFWICQGKDYIAYGSYEPKSFIEDKFPGWKERQKLVDLMSGFEKLTKKY